MLSADLDRQDDKSSASGLLAQDVLLSKGMAKGVNVNHAANPAIPLDSQCSLECEDGEVSPSLLVTCSNNQKCDTSSMNADLAKSQREEERRQKLRERKRVQRLNDDFAERERLRARGRIKALRQDPSFRQMERQRDKERRRKARLLNQNQRIQERERDKIHKSLMRSLDMERNEEMPINSSENGSIISADKNNGVKETEDSNVHKLPACPPP